MKDPMHKCGCLILSTGTLLCCVEFKGHQKPVEVTFCKPLEHNISKRVTLRDLILSMYILRTELRKHTLLETVRGHMWSKTTRVLVEEVKGYLRSQEVKQGTLLNPSLTRYLEKRMMDFSILGIQICHNKVRHPIVSGCIHSHLFKSSITLSTVPIILGASILGATQLYGASHPYTGNIHLAQKTNLEIKQRDRKHAHKTLALIYWRQNKNTRN